jgi:hypothetical protein
VKGDWKKNGIMKIFAIYNPFCILWSDKIKEVEIVGAGSTWGVQINVYGMNE